MATPPHKCGGCAARWGGTLACHCSACHQTFSGLTWFDKHRVRGNCLSVDKLKNLGLSEVRPGVWGQPGPGRP